MGVLIGTRIQPKIITGASVQPTIPSPTTLTANDVGFLASDIHRGEWCFNETDNIWYYRQNNTIQQLGGGGASDWGDLGGTLSDQTDLQAELDAKQDELVSATNIKTINGSSILGAGDLVVGGSYSQATEGVLGIAKLSTQAIIENEATTNDIDIVTPLKFWQGLARFKAIVQTFAAKITFTTAPRFSSTTASQILEVDGSKDLISVAKSTAYNKDFASDAETITGTETAKPTTPANIAAWWANAKTLVQTFAEFITFSKGILLSAYTNGSPSEGQIWIESNKLKARINTTTVSVLDSAGNLSSLSNITTGRQNIGLDYEPSTATFSGTVTWDFLQSSVQKTFDVLQLTATGDFTLDMANVGATGVLKIVRNTTSAVVITLSGTGLTHYNAETLITVLSLPSGLINEEFFLTFYKFDSKIFWITREGLVVNTLSASTSDIPSVGLVNTELANRHKQSGNAYGAALVVGSTDSFDVSIVRNGTERISALSAGARLTGGGTTTGQNFLVRNSASTQVIMSQDNGLVKIGTGTPASTLDIAGSISFSYRAITSLRTLDSTDNVIDCTTNTFTVTLPTSVGIAGRRYVIKNSGAGVITLATTSSQTIDGAATQSLSTQYDKITVTSNGSNWIITG